MAAVKPEDQEEPIVAIVVKELYGYQPERSDEEEEEERENEENVKERIEEWAALLANKGTAKAALRCLMYMYQAMKKAGIQEGFLDKDGIIQFDEWRIELKHNNKLEEFFAYLKQITESVRTRVDRSHELSYMSRFKNWFSGRVEGAKMFTFMNIVKKQVGRIRGLPSEQITIYCSESTAACMKDLESFATLANYDKTKDIVAEVLVNAAYCISRKLYFEECSPLIRAVKCCDFDAAVMLLSYGNPVDLLDRHGKTALYWAVESADSVMLIKLLLVFGANPFLSSDEMEPVIDMKMNEEISELFELYRTRRDASDEEEKGYEDEEGEDGIAKEKNDDREDETEDVEEKVEEANEEGDEESNEEEEESDEETPVTHLLSLDGGGLKGLVLTTILSELNHFVPNFYEKIEFCAGTSTGGILSLALAQGKSIDECRNIYFKFKDFVFAPLLPSQFHYDSEILEKFLKKTFGRQTMQELGLKSGKKVAVTSNCVMKGASESVLFKTYMIRPLFANNFLEKSDKEKPIPTLCFAPPEDCGDSEAKPSPKKTRVWEAAFYTSNAPLYFDHKGDHYVDGGIMNNNPTEMLLGAIMDYQNALLKRNAMHPNVSKDDEPRESLYCGALINIGTGDFEVKVSAPKRSGTLYNVIGFAIGKPLMSGIYDAIEIGMKFGKTALSTNGQQLERIVRLWEDKTSFFRFSPKFSEDIAMDETDNQRLVEMMWKTKVYINKELQGTEKCKKLQELFA